MKFQLANSLVQQTTLERYTVSFSCFSSTHDVSTMLTQQLTIALHTCIINSRFASCQQVQTSTVLFTNLNTQRISLQLSLLSTTQRLLTTCALGTHFHNHQTQRCNMQFALQTALRFANQLQVSNLLLVSLPSLQRILAHFGALSSRARLLSHTRDGSSSSIGFTKSPR